MALRLGIAGSGDIACGLARTAADACEVVLWARSQASADRAWTDLTGSVSATVVTELSDLAGSLDVVTELSELAGCDIVVEAISEDSQAKGELHRRLGELLPENAVIATTTSSLSVAGLAEASGRPERFGALHVFNPVPKMPLVELSFPDAASESTRTLLRDLCTRLGKTPVEVPDSAGFVVNKLLFPYLFDAVRMLERDGLGPEAIDTCMKLGAGHPMGPLRLLDLVGLDVAAAIGEAIGADVPDRVHELIAAGRLGRKSRAGFYEYE